MKKGLNTFLLFCMITLLAGCGHSVARYDQRLSKKLERQNFEAQVIESNGQQLFFWDNKNSEKPPLILVHGFGGDGKISWSRQINDFKDDYRVIIPDILWFGESYSDEEPSLVAQIEAIKWLIEELNLEKVNVVGISYGGFITLGLAHIYPENLRRIVIVNSPGAAISDAEIEAFCKSVGVEKINDAFVPKTGEDVQRLLDFSFYKKPPIPKFLMDEILAQYFSKNPVEQNKLLDELPGNREKLKGEVAVPVSIIWGEKDEIFTISEAYRLKDALNADLHVIEKAGHALPGEKPKEFNAVLRSVLEK